MAVTAGVLLISLVIAFYSIRPGNLKGIIRMSKEISVDRFLELRNRRDKDGRLMSEAADIPGVYIFHNISKRMYYVGQAHHMVSRANNHLTAKGNGRIYADYVNGDRFRIRFVRLKGSGKRNLNDLERKYIERYHAMEAGYNRTRGNK